jgi:hypothetical protein
MGNTFMRRAARVDNNQKQIVKDLRKFPNITVVPNHDDILVGFLGKTYWFEIKSDRALNKTGQVRQGEKQASQIALVEEWKGHYKIVTSLDEILVELGIPFPRLP